ncbi:MAG: orotate phosphoribosyltransferase [Proteobacteria bacterium]|nr:orotate phosphoribosyltransferase [Pseudomonadota bacterium]
MQNKYKSEFLDLVTQNNILRFGEFTLKSGRISPYFFNAGNFDRGGLLASLAGFYARCIHDNIGADFVLYGPAYKGIPLAAATAIKLAEEFSTDIPYAFNRKEAKDHGEGGLIVGAKLEGEVVIIDDVITAGTSIRESVDIIKAQGAKPSAVVIAVDRQERAGDSSRSAVQAVEDEYNIPVYSIVNLDDIVSYAEHSDAVPDRQAVEAYRERYGVQ